MELLLYVIAVLLFVFGVIKLVQRDFLIGVTLIVLALLVGPAGVSLIL